MPTPVTILSIEKLRGNIDKDDFGLADNLENIFEKQFGKDIIVKQVTDNNGDIFLYALGVPKDIFIKQIEKQKGILSSSRGVTLKYVELASFNLDINLTKPSADHKECEKKIEELVEQLQKRKESYNTTLAEHKIEVRGLEKTIESMRGAVQSSNDELSRLRTEVSVLQKEKNNHLQIITDLSERSDDPLKVAYSMIGKISSELVKYNELEKMLGEEIKQVQEIIDLGSKPLYVFVNKELTKEYTADSQLQTDTTKFEETEYGKANAEHYGKLQGALDKLKQIRDGAELLEGIVDLEKLSAKEAELNQFKKDYETRLAEHNSNLKIAESISCLKKAHDLAKAFHEYKEQHLTKTVEIPILVTASPSENQFITEIVMPSGGYVAKQVQLLVHKLFGDSQNAGEQGAFYKMQTDGFPQAAYSRLRDASLGERDLKALGFVIKPQMIVI